LEAAQRSSPALCAGVCCQVAGGLVDGIRGAQNVAAALLYISDGTVTEIVDQDLLRVR
jgi:hypothetical protein